MPTVRQQFVYDLRVLLSWCQFVHWNLTGVNFMPVHSYLDEVMQNIEDFIDWTAEDIRRSGLIVDASLLNAGTYTLIPAFPSGSLATIEDVRGLSEKIKTVVQNIHDNLGNFNASEQSSITNYTDTMLQNCYWLDSQCLN